MFENKQTCFRVKQNQLWQFQNRVFAVVKNFRRLVLIGQKIRENSNSVSELVVGSSLKEATTKGFVTLHFDRKNGL